MNKVELKNEQIIPLVISELERMVLNHMTAFDKATDAGDIETAEYHTGRESAFREVIKMLSLNVTFHVQVWDREYDRWESYGQGYTCAKAANKLADELLDRGYFARVVTDEEDV